MARYAFSVDPKLLTDFARRTGDLQQTLLVLHAKVRFEVPNETGTRKTNTRLPSTMRNLDTVKAVLDPEQIDELISEARGELELIAETLGHMLDRNV